MPPCISLQSWEDYRQYHSAILRDQISYVIIVPQKQSTFCNLPQYQIPYEQPKVQIQILQMEQKFS
jgi:hypothetical protein